MVQTAEYRGLIYSDDRSSSSSRISPPYISRSSSTRVSPFVGSYVSCNSIDELCERFNQYRRQVQDMANSYNTVDMDIDTQRRLNNGSVTLNDIPLGFHTVHGSNVMLLSNGKIARRKESFCKGLAFSNRPVRVDENICLRLNEVSTNWSGVLRFGVSNFDPESYRNTSIPKFACPDLTTKDGYWAKALPERYSVEGNILHFYINPAGELHYGINGSQKGQFLTGIKTHLPMWLIVDIYGNSIALEFIDASEFRFRRTANNTANPSAVPVRAQSVSPSVSTPTTSAIVTPSESNSSNALLAANLTPPTAGTSPMYFHNVTGRNVTLNAIRNIATREQSEYNQGYVFTERPIRNNEKITLMITNVQPLYEGGLAFGVTCCDPSTIRPEDLPSDSADLLDFPDYWVGVKDIALQPKLHTILSFWITDSGEVKFEMDNRGPRSVLFADNSLELYMYFDLYGSTISTKILGYSQVGREASPSARVAMVAPRPAPPVGNRVPLSIPTRPARDAPPAPIGRNGSRSSANSSGGLRVNIRGDSNEGSSSSTQPSTRSRSAVNLMDDDFVAPNLPPPIAPRRRPAPAQISIEKPEVSLPLPVSAPPVGEPPKVPFDELEEDCCVICFSEKINCVLYTCGHMCMCFDCAHQIHEKPNPTCPMCRAKIHDVIKCYKAV